MLDFGFVGFGQVGGLFCDLSKKYGYKSLAFNTAMVDLQVLESLDKHEKIHLIGYGGAGKDRSVGAEAFFQHIDTIKERIQEKFESCQVVFPVFAIGGGTGSGMSSHIIKLLIETFEDKVISPILFLPDKHESPRSHMNALEAFSEISSIEDIGATFIIDNQQVMELNQSLPLREKYQISRKEILNWLTEFNVMTEKESSVSNFDKMDLLTVLSERGCAMFSTIQIDKDDIKDSRRIAERLVKSLEFSIFAREPISQVSKVAIGCEIPNDLTPYLKLESIFSSIGLPLEVFTGIYETENKSKIHSLLTGLPFPTKLLKEIEDDIRKKESLIVKTLDTVRSQSFDMKSSWTNSLKRTRRVKV